MAEEEQVEQTDGGEEEAKPVVDGKMAEFIFLYF